MRIHRIYCKSVSETKSVFQLDHAQSMHLSKVLRLSINDEVEVFDGLGSSAICKIIEVARSSVSLERIGNIKIDEISNTRLGFVLPLIKKENFQFMIQKLCEVGASEFIFYKPDLIDQSIAKKDSSKIYNKSEEVIISACKQCGANLLPKTNFSSSLAEALLKIDQSSKIFVFDVEAKDSFNTSCINSNNIFVITGAESGFSDAELKLMKEKDFSFKLLSKNILRAETAPIVVASLIQNHFDKI
ncbi:16S rRNA (uracil(1498)-N(3))-methyltransferase [Gammaproteobacteria bacterium]|nr:16S rRNA (uracil(1498)-N(3))-methyltransferase [Gammaproteobacteria bacterium]